LVLLVLLVLFFLYVLVFLSVLEHLEDQVLLVALLLQERKDQLVR